ncbi:biotin/lipoyl-binding protein [Hymenobacter sp. UYP22]|uniref:biotin/lipoyl-binding protein n=1 Tax=Hymenobacter sp. UYP22 TaxID=3156348 RepID=UPI0033920A2C
MKKLVGLGLILTVAAGSAMLPLWLPTTDAQASSFSSAPAQFQLVARTLPDSATAVTGQPIAAGQAGRVHEVYVQDGQRVKQGQLLLKLLERLPSVQQQQLQARLHRQQLAFEALQQQPATTPELATARQQLEDTRARLAQCVPMLSFVYVTAPAAGTIRQPSATLGDQLTAHSVVALLAPELPADTTLLLTSVE